jgi:hypothetical protein
MSSAKPANVDQVVAISFENGFGIEEITTPTSYERDQIAAQVVFDIKSWEYAVAPVIPENIFYRTELTSAQINETINRSALPITQSN